MNIISFSWLFTIKFSMYFLYLQLERDQCVGEEPMLNNRVEPSWRANNYYDNLRSTSFQNALSREPEMLHRDAKRVSLAPHVPSMRRQLHLCKDNLHPSGISFFSFLH